MALALMCVRWNPPRGRAATVQSRGNSLDRPHVHAPAAFTPESAGTVIAQRPQVWIVRFARKRNRQWGGSEFRIILPAGLSRFARGLGTGWRKDRARRPRCATAKNWAARRRARVPIAL